MLIALAMSGDRALDDEELAHRIRRSDHEAFRTFFERHHGLLFGYLRRRGVPSAVCEDLVQQAFVTIWERRAEIDPRKSLRAYLFKISHNRALNHFRDTAKLVSADALNEMPASSNPEGPAEYAQMLQLLQDVIEMLPERRRAVFELCFVEGLTYREAADALDVSVRTVEHQMGHALKALRRAFEHYLKEEENKGNR